MVGENLPRDDFKISMANYECSNYEVNSQQIVCYLEVQPAAGIWYVKLMTAKGLVPVVSSSIERVEVPLFVTEMSPSTFLNQVGGDILTFTGQGFDQVLDYTLVLFGDDTVCTPIEATFNSLKCQVDGFDMTKISANSQGDLTTTVIVYVNGIADKFFEVTLMPVLMKATNILPESISPINSSQIRIQLSSPYLGIKEAEFYTVEMYNIYDSSISVGLTVTGIDNLSGGSLVLRYLGGVSSGYYKFRINASDVGKIDTEDIQLLIVSRITGISPIAGSSLGGTLLTINGENFSNDVEDHEVTVGDSKCEMVRSSLV